MDYELWYRNGTEDWNKGLPVGNGRLAAMVVANDGQDRLALNHERLWKGTHKDRTTENVSAHLPEVRQLLKEEKHFEATMLANVWFGGKGGSSRIAGRVDSYQPAGDLLCKLKGVSKTTRRSLNINTGVAETERTYGNGKIVSRAMVSCVDDRLFYEMRGTEPFDAEISLCRIPDENAVINITFVKNTIRLKGALEGISYEAAANVCTDGCLIEQDGTVQVQGASYVGIVLNIEIEQPADIVQAFDFGEAFERHETRFRSRMGALKFQISDSVPEKPTDELLAGAKAGKHNNYLSELYVHYGRYLLLSSSLCGDYPANLQGKWNELLNPPWDSDYHFDINLQMNYWMAEPCNMPECADALLRYIESYYESGEKAAMDLYGCRGIYLPIQSDIWGRSTPEAYGWAVWIGAAGWMAQHFWQHYLYSGDLQFLKDRAYPYFVKVAEFYEDYLCEDEEGVLQIMPSQSPENSFEGTGYFTSICISSAMDIELAHDALGYAISSAEILNVDPERVQMWKDMQNRLPKLQIGSDGRLLEWDKERTEVEPGHRHLSHLYGLYPSDLFMQEAYQNVREAAVNSLYYRLSHGGGHTGWSRAWVACLMARIGDKEGFSEHFHAMLTDFATDSLLDLIPPDVFQIEGNFGAVAAAIEALVSCCDGKVYLLKGLPPQWSDGLLEGVKTPGGHILELEWKNRELVRLQVTIGYSGRVLFGETEALAQKEIKGKPEEVVRVL